MKKKMSGLLYILFGFGSACLMLYMAGALALRKSLLYFHLIY